MIAKRNSKKVVKTKQGKKKDTKSKTQSDSNLIRSITKLHNEILQSYRLTVSKGIEIGKLLTDVKDELKHGDWLPFVAKLPFSSRTVTNYMNLHKYSDEIKSANVSNIYEAYKLLSNIKNHHRTVTRHETKKRRKKFADKKSNFKNPRIGDYIDRVIQGDNLGVMKEMLKHGMAGKYSGIVTSSPYNAGFYYSHSFDDNKPYKDYLKDILKRFPLYSKLLRKGGRVIYVIGNVVKKENRDDKGSYNHQLVNDLINGVDKIAPELRFYDQIIWEKTARSRNPLNNNYGTYASPKAPTTRSCNENILVWSNKQFELENVENTEPDITPDEFKQWAWSVWSVAAYTKPGNPHPCSYPSKLIERILKFYFWKNDLILDPYAGVSTTGVVCKKLGRRFTGIDLNPNYCEYGSELIKSA